MQENSVGMEITEAEFSLQVEVPAGERRGGQGPDATARGGHPPEAGMDRSLVNSSSFL